MMLMKQGICTLLLAAFFLSGAVSAAEMTPKPKDVQSQAAAETVETVMPALKNGADSDPLLTTYNHAVFHFNDMLDRVFLKPVATLYNKLVPKPLHEGISNFFTNIDNIPTLINDILQGNVYYTFHDGWRLVINTTVGIVGIFDVATRIGLKPHHEDFGLTMARWGYTNSNYIEVPFFGGGTIRDVIGWPIDYFFFSIYPYIKDPVVRYSVYGVGVVDRRSNVLQYQDVLDQIAVDRYSFYRSAYMQHRQFQIEANKKFGPAVDDKGPPDVNNIRETTI